MVMGSKSGRMVHPTKATSLITRWRVKAFMSGQMAANTMEIGMKTCSTVRVFSRGPTVESMTVAG